MTVAGRSLLTVVALVVLVGAACSSGGDSGAGAGGSGDEQAPPDPREALAEPAPGQGAAVIGFEELTFTVDECVDGPRPDDTPAATLDYEVRGSGRSSDGPFTVSITRFSSDTGTAGPVITETARVVFAEVASGDASDLPGSDTEGEADAAPGGHATTGSDGTVVEARRTNAGPKGTWLDLADPTAEGPLVERTGAHVDVRGAFGPPAATAGVAGIEPGRLRATCPA